MVDSNEIAPAMANDAHAGPAASAERPIRFGAFELDARTGELRKHGIRIRLREQSLQVLLMLLERRGEVVPREEIRQRLWANDTNVEFDHGINVAVQRLRDALGESAQDPRFIETLARRGYRFLVPTLDAPTPEPEAGVPEPPIPARKPPRPFGPISLPAALGAGVLLGAVAVGLIPRPRPPEPELRFLLAPPAQIPEPAAPQISLSPDGRLLALITAGDHDRKRSLWIRTFRSFDATRLVSDSGFESPMRGYPFWSPDGKFVAYFTEGGLWKIAAAGGPPQKICDAGSGEGGAWSGDGTILFGTAAGPLYQVPPTGGKPTPVTQLDQAAGEMSHTWPQFLPDGRHFLYLVRNKEKSAIYAQGLGTSFRKLIVKSQVRAMYAAPGYLVFPSGNTLAAQLFDPDRLEVRGNPVPIGEVLANRENGRAAFSVSQTGVLAYRAPPQHPHQAISCDRQGNCIPIGEPTRLTNLSLSPDERYLALTTFDNSIGENLWLLQLATGAVSKSPVEPSPYLGKAVWSPDSHHYAVAGGLESRIESAGIDELAARLVFSSSESRRWMDDWSLDGRFLLLHDSSAIFLLTADGKGGIEKLAGIAGLSGLQLSPDGRRVAYATSGPRPQVYVAAFPSFDDRKLVSTDDACQPRWRADGKELFYVSPRDGNLMVLAFGSGAPPQRLFRPGLPLACNWSQYAVSHDGQRIYAYQLKADPERASDINVAINWAEPLRK